MSTARQCQAAVVAALLLAAPAAAQSLDRGALEQLFGEPVTTAATGKPQRASDVPVAMDIITAEQIRRSGARDIPEVLARYTSLDVQQYNAADYAVGIRGYATPATPRVLVLLNGRQVYLDDFGQTIWAAIPVQLAEIRQIEVVRGPNTALFGFNAAAGAINIVTWSALHDRVNTGTVRVGSNGYREASAVASAGFGQGGVRLSAGLREEHGWNRGFTAVDRLLGGPTAPSRGSFAAEVMTRVADNVELGFDASYAAVRAGELMTTGAIVRNDRTVWSVRGRVLAETAIGTLEVALFRNQATLSLPTIDLHGNQAVTSFHVSDTVKLGTAHTLRPFVKYRLYEGWIDARHIDYQVATAGVMWNWVVNDAIETTAAVRYDHLWLTNSGYGLLPDPFPQSAYTRDWGRPAWTFGMVWTASDRDTVRLTAARGISAPSLKQLGPPGLIFLPLGGGAGIGLGNAPNLRPLVVDNYEIGYRRRIAAIDGRIEFAVFHQENRDMNSGLALRASMLVPGVPFPVSVPQNVGNSSATGAEVAAGGRLPRGFDWDLRYRLVATDSNASLLPLNYKRASPRHLLVGRLGWAEGPWQSDVFLRYASMMEGFRLSGFAYVPTRVEDAVTLAARVAYRFDNGLTLALEGSGLLQERQRLSIGLDAERRVYASLRFDL